MDFNMSLNPLSPSSSHSELFTWTNKETSWLSISQTVWCSRYLLFLHEADGSGQRLVITCGSRSRNVFRDPAELQIHVMIKLKQQHWCLQLSSTLVQRLLERLKAAAQSATDQHHQLFILPIREQLSSLFTSRLFTLFLIFHKSMWLYTLTSRSRTESCGIPFNSKQTIHH